MSVWVLLMTAVPGWQSAAEPFGVSSASAILYEPERGLVLYEKDIHTPRSMASTTKVMTGLLALEQGDLDREITVPAEAVRVEGSALGLRGGDTISMRDLVIGLLLESGNDAANVIAYVLDGSIPAFAERMNARAAEIGMKDTTFVTPSGLDEGEHSSSAYDMALLAAEAMKNEDFAAICSLKTAVIRFGNPMREVTVRNHNKLLSLYDDAIGIKTGFTKKSGKCLVSAARRDGVLLIAVTLNGGDYWNDHMSLYEYGFQQVESVTLPVPELPELPVAGGECGQLSLTASGPPSAVLPKGQADQVTCRVYAPSFLLAPVEAGTVVGEARYYFDGKEIGRATLTVSEGTPARPVAGYGERFMRMLTAMLRVWAGLDV